MKKLSLLLLFAVILVSCRSQQLIRPGDTLQVAYAKAYSLFDEERWDDAISAFETVISIGRGTDIGRDSQYYLAESYYNNRQYLIAASEYERYATSFPNDPRLEEVDYKTALSYYQLSPRYNVDQTHTKRALERFRLFMARHPNSEWVEDAGNRVEELQEKLARKHYEAAEFYMRTNRYRAAATYFDIVIDRFPGTSWAEQALVDQIDAYIRYADNSVQSRQEERYQMALESYEKYLQLFPRGSNRSRAENLYDRAREALIQIGDEPVTSVRNLEQE